MATTLAQLAENSQDKIAQGFINEIITDSYLLGAMTFDDCMSNNGQSDLTYGYRRVITGATASFRSLDEEGAVSDVEVKKYTTNVAILNSTFQMDRVAAKAAPDLLDLKLTEAKNAIIRKFNSTLIAGDTATDAKGFDGLSKALAGSSTEVKSAVDITTVAKIKENALAFADELDGLLSLLDGDPSVILCGRAMKVKLNTIAKALGISQLMADDAGKQIDNWGGIPIQKLTDGAIATNDLYAVRLGMDGFHGVTLEGGNAITVTPPDMTAAGAVHKGDAEFVVGCALKATKAAGVLRSYVAG